MTDAILETLREEAQGYAEANLNHGDPTLRSILQKVYVEGYVAGGASVIKKELVDRIAEKYTQEQERNKHNKKLKTAYKKAPKV